MCIINSNKEIKSLIFDDIKVTLNIKFMFNFSCKKDLLAVTHFDGYFMLFYNPIVTERDTILWGSSIYININTDFKNIMKDRLNLPWNLITYEQFKTMLFHKIKT
jgi:hypothetical protein